MQQVQAGAGMWTDHAALEEEAVGKYTGLESTRMDPEDPAVPFDSTPATARYSAVLNPATEYRAPATGACSAPIRDPPCGRNLFT